MSHHVKLSVHNESAILEVKSKVGILTLRFVSILVLDVDMIPKSIAGCKNLITLLN
jgi:hypothetical protein